ncbi:MAG: cytochrome c [Bryobacteraceae bacterium]
MKKWLRVLGWGVAGVATLAAAGVGWLVVRKPAMAPPSNIRVSATPERIARGKHLFLHVADCAGCHTPRDFTRFSGPIAEAMIGAGFEFPAELGLPGRIVAPNITPDNETGIGTWTDGEKIRAIREGISKDGRALFPMMPYQGFRNMSDEDVFSLVAYMNSLPAVRTALPSTKVDFPVNLLIKSAPEPVASVPPAPQPADKLAHGRYLATLAGCGGCHTRAEKGRAVEGMEFAGGEAFRTKMGTAVSANITPDKDTGIGKWSERDFVKKFHDYRDYAANGSPRVGPEGFTVMPWLGLSQLSEDELGSIYTFLRTQKPVYHSVETHPVLVSQRAN